MRSGRGQGRGNQRRCSIALTLQALPPSRRRITDGAGALITFHPVTSMRASGRTTRSAVGAEGMGRQLCLDSTAAEVPSPLPARRCRPGPHDLPGRKLLRGSVAGRGACEGQARRRCAQLRAMAPTLHACPAALAAVWKRGRCLERLAMGAHSPGCTRHAPPLFTPPAGEGASEYTGTWKGGMRHGYGVQFTVRCCASPGLTAG